MAGLRRQIRFLLSLRMLPPRVACFQWRADRLARRAGDSFSIDSAVRPRELAYLLRLASGREHVAEIGTGTGLTTISFALNDRQCHVTSFDPVRRSERERYLRLVREGDRERIELRAAPGLDGAADSRPVDLLFVDSSHDREETIAEYNAWLPVLAADAIVAFHDYGHTDYPGVERAIGALGLQGEVSGTLFVWRRGGPGHGAAA